AGYELFDTPMDFQVLLEGNYYQDPSIPDDQPTWFYSVVVPSFQCPAGVQYEILAQIHLPDESHLNVETEAERLAADADMYAMVSNPGGDVVAPVMDCAPD